MAHSIELLFDPDTEAVLRRMWDDLGALKKAGLAIRIPPGRPHVTVAVAQRIAPDVDELLIPVARELPVRCVIGAPVLFGRANVVFTRLIVPSRALLDLHAEVHRLCGPHLVPEPMANSLPGQWTAHVTLARRMDVAHLGAALAIAGRPAQFEGCFAGLRRWDGDQRVEYPIG
ncbi:2'-5' RNA ligase family protein [Mycobacterium camsae]|uniref:2'-5' RNA ligase family protein n=1 Tax=Mycobacterium gordonae TaxID=1778 RepID=UPI00197E216C|nr:2'-5' RNA ligase family protein [Mycobacterium gordonae]